MNYIFPECFHTMKNLFKNYISYDNLAKFGYQGEYTTQTQ